MNSSKNDHSKFQHIGKQKKNNRYFTSRTYSIQLVLLLISLSSFAQIGFNYKAQIKDSSGNLVINQDIDIRFSLQYIDEFTNTITYYVEEHSPTTNASGSIIINIGEGTVISGSFPISNWNKDTFLLTEIDIEQDGTFENLGTTDFKKTPMAIRANYAIDAFNAVNAQYAVTAQTANNVTGLEQITEEGNTGWRLIGVDYPTAYGLIGENAVDISYQEPINVGDGATGQFSIAMGRLTTAFGSTSTAMGNETEALGTNSTAMGQYTIASGYNSTAMGNQTTASGYVSTAMGRSTKADSRTSTAIGAYNIGGGNPTEWIETDPLFEIGNGSSSTNKHNALTVLKNGNIGIGRSTPSSLLEVGHQNGAPTSADRTNAFSIRNLGTGRSWQMYTEDNGYLLLFNDGNYRGSFNPSTGAYGSISDRRVKKDIMPLADQTLHKVMQLNPVSYVMKNQTDKERQLGLISQEVKEVFPEITNYIKERDLLEISYTELIPILIKAIQEQQDIIKVQNTHIKTLLTDNSSLQKNVNNLIARVEKIEADNL